MVTGPDAGRRDRGLSGQRPGPGRSARTPPSTSTSSSLHDTLTGLPEPPPAARAPRARRVCAAAARAILALLFVDLDRFKAVNDIHGHLVGDDLLVAVAQRMTGQLRPGDTLARLSGRRVRHLCEDLDNNARPTLIAKRILEALAAPFALVRPRRRSVGERRHRLRRPRATTIPDQLLHDADIAMYQAKRSGGGTHQVIDLREQRLAERRSLLERDLRGALRRRRAADRVPADRAHARTGGSPAPKRSCAGTIRPTA